MTSHPTIHTSPYRTSIEMRRPPPLASGLTQPLPIPATIFNVSPINPAAEGSGFAGYSTVQPGQGPQVRVTDADIAHPESTFLLTLSPHQQQVAPGVPAGEDTTGMKASEVLCAKIDGNVKNLMRTIQERCERLQETIDKLMHDDDSQSRPLSSSHNASINRGVTNLA